MNLVDGRLYGRNYGHVFLALPILWALEAVALVADPRIAVAGGWSLLLLAFADQAGAVWDRRDQFAAAGAVAAAILFGANVVVAQPLWGYWFELAALQLSSMAAAGFVSVLIYRLLSEIHDRRTGLFAGAAVAFASPVAVWATIPKRHSLTALFVVATMYALYRSRTAPGGRDALAYRALAYVPVGPMTWIHAPEGVILLVSLGLVDVLTARSNDPRHLIVVCAAFALSMLPVLITNALISGDPLAVPRSLPSYDGRETVLGAGGDPTTGGDGAGAGDHSVVGVAILFAEQLIEGARTLSSPGDLYRTFVVWESPGELLGETETKELAVFQSMPLVGILLSVPLVGYRRLKRAGITVERKPRANPPTVIDAFALVYLAVLLLVYLPRLPVHTTLTVRYLHPIYPIAVYFVARLDVVRTVLFAASDVLVRSYAGFVLIGGSLLYVTMLVVPEIATSAVQFHGLVSLAAGVLAATWALLATLRDGYEEVGAVVAGLVGSVTTLFVVYGAVLYFRMPSDFVLPVSRIVAEAIELP